MYKIKENVLYINVCLNSQNKDKTTYSTNLKSITLKTISKKI